MRKNLIIVAVFFMLGGSIIQVSARLGETMEQCKARYGNPWDSNKDHYDLAITNYYKVGSYSIEIRFYKNEALMIGYTRLDMAPFIDEEVQHFLAVNAQPSPWKETIPTRCEIAPSPWKSLPDKEWKREDGSIAEIFSNEQCNIISAKLGDAINEGKAEVESKRLQETRDSLNKL